MGEKEEGYYYVVSSVLLGSKGGTGSADAHLCSRA